MTPRTVPIVASAGVSLYLTKNAILATLRETAALAPGSTLAMTFVLPPEFAEPEERTVYEAAQKGGTGERDTFHQFLCAARDVGNGPRYFAGRAAGFGRALRRCF